MIPATTWNRGKACRYSWTIALYKVLEKKSSTKMKQTVHSTVYPGIFACHSLLRFQKFLIENGREYNFSVFKFLLFEGDREKSENYIISKITRYTIHLIVNRGYLWLCLFNLTIKTFDIKHKKQKRNRLKNTCNGNTFVKS